MSLSTTTSSPTRLVDFDVTRAPAKARAALAETRAARSGTGGIRTLGRGFPLRRFSKPVPSASRPPFLIGRGAGAPWFAGVQASRVSPQVQAPARALGGSLGPARDRPGSRTILTPSGTRPWLESAGAAPRQTPAPGVAARGDGVRGVSGARGVRRRRRRRHRPAWPAGRGRLARAGGVRAADRRAG